MTPTETTCHEIPHGSDEYRRTVALRDAILRKPLNLRFDPAELAAESDSHHLVCRVDGALAACLVLRPDTNGRCQMRQFAVRADLQGRGIGRTLAAYAEEFARGRNYTEIVMHARETALGFYETLGYRREGERFLEVGIPHIVMRKRLGTPSPCDAPPSTASTT